MQASAAIIGAVAPSPARSRPTLGSIWLRSPGIFWGLAIVHGLAAIAFRGLPQLGLLHVGLVVLLGTRAVLADRNAVLPVLGYLAGCELLWRANGVPTLWETGKLLSCAWVLLAMFRWGRRSGAASTLVLACTCLLPGVVMSWLYFRNLAGFRQALTTEFAGTAFLAIGTTMILSVRPQPRMIRTLAAFLIPTLGFGLLVLWGILTAEKLEFSTESNMATSGGYGPVQVSSLLGAAVLSSLLLALQIRMRAQRWLMFTASLFLLNLSVFTFSRTGTYCAVLGSAALAIHTIRDPRRALTFALGASAILGLALWVVLPRLNDLSGGALLARYQDPTSQSRLRIAESDLRIFGEHQLLGRGAGVSRYHRLDPSIQGYSSHTEFTRILADHGLLGAIVYLCIFATIGMLYLRQPSLMHRACAAAIAAAGTVSMASLALRMALPSFCFVFAASLLVPLEPGQGTSENRRL